MQTWKLVFKSQWTIGSCLPLSLTDLPFHLTNLNSISALLAPWHSQSNSCYKWKICSWSPKFMVTQLGCKVLHMHTLKQPGLPWLIACSQSLGVGSLSNVAQCALKVGLGSMCFGLKQRLSLTYFVIHFHLVPTVGLLCEETFITLSSRSSSWTASDATLFVIRCLSWCAHWFSWGNSTSPVSMEVHTSCYVKLKSIHWYDKTKTHHFEPIFQWGLWMHRMAMFLCPSLKMWVDGPPGLPTCWQESFHHV